MTVSVEPWGWGAKSRLVMTAFIAETVPFFPRPLPTATAPAEIFHSLTMTTTAITLRILAAFAATTAAALSLRAQAAPDLAKPAKAGDDTVQLDRFVVTDANSLKTTLPVRPVNGVYGFDTSYQDVPRSITQINPQQFANDVIISVSDFARYSPAVNQSTGQIDNYGTPTARGAQGDGYQNGVRLLTRPQNNRPYTINAYEGADIVAGPASVILGPSARTAGYVNYVTKKPYFDRQRGSVSFTVGGFYGDGEGYKPQSKWNLDLGGPILEGKLAYRFSYEGNEKQTYYRNAANRYHDFYGSLGWLPNASTAVDWNFEYGTFDWTVNNFQNRVTSELIRDGTYLGGPATPIIQVGSAFFSPTLDALGNVTGWTTRSRVANADGTTAFNPGVAVANPTANTTAGAGTIVGYVLDPALVRPTALDRSAALNAPNSPSETTAFNTQLRVKNVISPALTVVNNATYQYYKTDTASNGGFYNWIEAKTFEHRLEALLRFEGAPFGFAITHQSNNGISYRYEPSRNYKDGQRAGYGPTGDQFDLTAPAEGYTRNAYFGATVFPFTGTVNDPVLTRFGYLKGFWAYYPVPESPSNFVSPGGTATGTVVGNLAGQVYDTTQKNLGFYTQHSVKLGSHLILDFGLRQTLVEASIFNPLPSPLVPGNDKIGNSIREWVPTWSTSLSYKPVPRLTTYATYQRVQAANGNTGGVVGWKTEGFGATAVPNRLLASDFHSLSVLHEIGAKAELIPNQLVASVAAYKQTRDLTLSLPAGFTEPVQAKGLYQGIEVGLRYQPNPRFNLGLNYTNLSAITLNSTYSNGAPIVADNSTNIISSTTAVIRDYRITNLPRNQATLYTTYAFAAGFGLRADLTATDAYNVSNSGSISVPGNHRLNVGVFYNTSRYRVSLDVQNATNRDSRAGGSAPLEPINAQSRITYRF